MKEGFWREKRARDDALLDEHRSLASTYYFFCFYFSAGTFEVHERRENKMVDWLGRKESVVCENINGS